MNELALDPLDIPNSSSNQITQAQFQALFDSDSEIVAFLDSQGRIISYNNLAESWVMRALGKELKVGISFKAYLRHSQSIDYFFRALRGEKCSFATTIPHADGTIFTFAVTFKPMFDEAGVQTGLVFLAQDISLHQKLQHDHAESQERLLSLIQSACDILRIEDADGTVTFISPAVKRVLKFRPSELIGKKWGEFVHPEDQDELEQHQRRILKKHETIRHQQRVSRKDGSWAHLECIRTLLNDEEHGQLVVVSSREISERVHVEEGLRAARDRALEAAKIKSEFLANISHEIRTPMNAIIGMTGLLIESELSPEQKHYAQIVRRSAESLLGLINGILDFSKAESGTLKLASGALDLREVVEDVLQLLAEDASKKNVELIYWADLDFPRTINGDTDKLRQILVNLVGNAVKFTRSGQVTVRLKTKKLSGTNWSALIEVTDTGIGIAKDAHDQLFKAFSQVDGSATRKFGGTGLGLAICKQLVSLMGGKIGVASEEGKGSRFWFTFPLKREHVSATRAEMPVVSIACITDNASLGISLSRMLKDLGFQQVVVLGAAQAGRALESDTAYGLFVVDTAVDLGRNESLKNKLEETGSPMIELMPFHQGDAAAMKLRKPVRSGELLEMLSRVTHMPAQAPALVAVSGTGDVEGALRELRESMGAELASDLVSLFVSEATSSLDEIERELHEGNLAAASSPAERLVSGCSSLGINSLRDSAKQLAAVCRSENREAATEALQMFRALFEQAVAMAEPRLSEAA